MTKNSSLSGGFAWGKINQWGIEQKSSNKIVQFHEELDVYFSEWKNELLTRIRLLQLPCYMIVFLDFYGKCQDFFIFEINPSFKNFLFTPAYLPVLVNSLFDRE